MEQCSQYELYPAIFYYIAGLEVATLPSEPFPGFSHVASLGLSGGEHRPAHWARSDGRPARVCSLAGGRVAGKAVGLEVNLNGADGAAEGMITAPAVGKAL